jgi:hypothetical protein
VKNLLQLLVSVKTSTLVRVSTARVLTCLFVTSFTSNIYVK